MIMKTLDKVIDVWGKPINFNIVLASLLTSFFLLATNFLPIKYLKRLYLEKFLDNYNYIILIVFFVSFFLVVIHISAQISKRKKDIAFNKFYYKQQDSLFQDEEALKILEKLYAIHPKAGWLHIYNQKVQLLEQYGLITASGSFANFCLVWLLINFK